MREIEDDKDPVETAREDERRRIASELHDRVLQALANVALRLEAARKHLVRTDTTTQKDLEISAEGVRSSIREIRGVLTSGSDRTWRVGTLLEKIRDEVRAIEQDTALHISLQLDPPDMAISDLRIEYDVFQATSEALRNLVRHAEATEARLRIALAGNTLHVSLWDNGKGFDSTTASAPRPRIADQAGNYGLESMRVRIERLGGRMAIRSGPGQGATVSFDVPMDASTRGSNGGEDKPGRAGSKDDRSARSRPLRWLLPATIIAGGIATLVFVFQPREPTRLQTGDVNVLDSAVRHYNQVSEGVASGDASRSRFELLDLSPWGYKILSKKTRQVNGTISRAFVYQEETTKDLLVAEEFTGVTLPLQVPTQTFGTTNFTTYSSQKGVNAVAWNENDTLCVLTSSMPRNDLLDLARRVSRKHVAAGIPGVQ